MTGTDRASTICAVREHGRNRDTKSPAHDDQRASLSVARDVLRSVAKTAIVHVLSVLPRGIADLAVRAVIAVWPEFKNA